MGTKLQTKLIMDSYLKHRIYMLECIIPENAVSLPFIGINDGANNKNCFLNYLYTYKEDSSIFQLT